MEEREQLGRREGGGRRRRNSRRGGRRLRSITAPSSEGTRGMKETYDAVKSGSCWRERGRRWQDMEGVGQRGVKKKKGSSTHTIRRKSQCLVVKVGPPTGRTNSLRGSSSTVKRQRMTGGIGGNHPGGVGVRRGGRRRR